jgi:hypothetical protein
VRFLMPPEIVIVTLTAAASSAAAIGSGKQKSIAGDGTS